MPRKGWQSVDVPSGWVQIIRGPRPKAATWPRRGETPQPVQSRQRRQSNVPFPPAQSRQRRQSNVPFPRQEPVDPDTALANARSRVTKLERAMEVVGESDPIYPGLVDALKRARTQAQVRPVADRISATESFIERARKRAEKERKEVEKAKAELAKAEAQLVLEEESLREGENRLLVLRQEANGEDQSPLATVPVDFAQELVQLRTMVQDLLREREQLKSELAGQVSTPHEEGRPRKARSLASPSPDLMSISNQPALGNCRDPSRLMETLINRADTALRSSWASASEQVVA